MKTVIHKLEDGSGAVILPREMLNSLNLHRHWRNARTHTLHDPASWKVQHLGRYALEGTLPPNHGQL